MANFTDVTVEDYYTGLDEWLRGVKGMNIARWKLLQNTAISILVGYLAIEGGADPTISVFIIALINGISIADLATIWGVSMELRGEESPEERDRNENQETKNESVENDSSK